MPPWWRAALNPRLAASQPSYSKPILTSTRYSTISPSATMALDLTTSIVWMLRTVFDAVATAWRAASLQELGLFPTISRMMMTPTCTPPGVDSTRSGHHATCTRTPLSFTGSTADNVRPRRSSPNPDRAVAARALPGPSVPARHVRGPLPLLGEPRRRTPRGRRHASHHGNHSGH